MLPKAYSERVGMNLKELGLVGLKGAVLTAFVGLCGCETTIVRHRPAPPPPPRVVSVQSVEYVPYVPIHQKVEVHPVREFHRDARVDYRHPNPPPKKAASKPVKAPPKKMAPKPIKAPVKNVASKPVKAPVKKVAPKPGNPPSAKAPPRR